MNHQDHVTLLRPGIPQPGGVWADLGAGDGAFTLALAELIGRGGTIYAIDKNGRSLRQLSRRLQSQFPGVTLYTQTADFTRPLDLPSLDGIVMANSLHFVRDKRPLLTFLKQLLKENGRLLIVEYNTDRGNRWVPHPFSAKTWEQLASQSGFSHAAKLASRPSRFLGEIYSAIAQ